MYVKRLPAHFSPLLKVEIPMERYGDHSSPFLTHAALQKGSVPRTRDYVTLDGKRDLEDRVKDFEIGPM